MVWKGPAPWQGPFAHDTVPSRSRESKPAASGRRQTGGRVGTISDSCLSPRQSAAAAQAATAIQADKILAQGSGVLGARARGDQAA